MGRFAVKITISGATRHRNVTNRDENRDLPAGIRTFLEPAGRPGERR
jgi:hypothetical protein